MSEMLNKRVRILKDCDIPPDSLPLGRCVAVQRNKEGKQRYIVVLDVREHTETAARIARMTKAGYCCTGLVKTYYDEDIEVLEFSP